VGDSHLAEPIHTRSLMLSAPEEGIIAKMDLVDVSSSEAIPVDYKRGPRAGGRWRGLGAGTRPALRPGIDPPRQRLLVRGRHPLFHRVAPPRLGRLRRRAGRADRELLRAIRRMGASGRLPPPLDDSPKCPRCSLVGICLPDETTLLREAEGRPAAGNQGRPVRRLLPARQDALPLYVREQGRLAGQVGRGADREAQGRSRHQRSPHRHVAGQPVRQRSGFRPGRSARSPRGEFPSAIFPTADGSTG
jgi:CRISPR-associated protein Cas1